MRDGDRPQDRPGPRDPHALGSLRRGPGVIDGFARQESRSPAELAAALAASRPAIFRILHAPGDFGHVRKDGAAVSQEQLRWPSLLPRQDPARETGETVQVGILHDNGAICVQAVEGTRLIRRHAFAGRRTAPHAGALGKVLLAALTDAEVGALLARGPLKGFAPRAIVAREGLRAEPARVRRHGYALDEEEPETGLRCMGVPIAEDARPATAALGLSAPAARMDAGRAAALVPLVRSKACRIAQTIGAT